MTALSPTRVSIYDFLIEDTLPIDSVFADSGNISIPQARLIIENGIQAITSGLLAFEQRYGSSAIQKKVFNRYQINELRKYNAFNLITIDAVNNFGYQNLDILFEDHDVQHKICQKISKTSSLSISQLKPLLGSLTSICIRELAILSDFTQLDHHEISKWFQLQSQFLTMNRSGTSSSNNNKETSDYYLKVPKFDLSWHDITGYKTINTIDKSDPQDIPNYAKVIGNTSQTYNLSNSDEVDDYIDKKLENNEQLIVDTNNESDILTFSHIEDISLPYQRWLLQLAKVSDIYLSRQRLKIAPEPVKKPARPFVNLGFLERQTTTSKDLDSITNKSNPFWKNPILFTLVVVVGILFLMAFAKFYYKNTYNNHQLEDPNVNQIDS